MFTPQTIVVGQCSRVFHPNTLCIKVHTSVLQAIPYFFADAHCVLLFLNMVVNTVNNCE